MTNHENQDLQRTWEKSELNRLREKAKEDDKVKAWMGAAIFALIIFGWSMWGGRDRARCERDAYSVALEDANANIIEGNTAIEDAKGGYGSDYYELVTTIDDLPETRTVEAEPESCEPPPSDD